MTTLRSPPVKVLKAILAREGLYSDHAEDHKIWLGLTWDDVESIAETGTRWDKERDERVPGDYKYSTEGRDVHGRPLYMSGKVARDAQDETIWYVITIHEAGRHEVPRVRKG